MIKQISVFFIFFSILLSPSCSDDLELVEMAISETGCMNPWNNFSTDKKDKIKAYLNDQGIWVKNVTRHQYSEGPFCESCACPTGYLVIIQILEKDIGKAEEIGFSKILEEGN